MGAAAVRLVRALHSHADGGTLPAMQHPQRWPACEQQASSGRRL